MSPSSKERVRILQCCSLPPRIFEIVGEQSQRCALLSIPGCHPPQPREYLFLLQRKIVQTAIDWIPLLGPCVFVPCNDLELYSLLFVRNGLNLGPLSRLTRVSMSVIHMNIPLARASFRSILPAKCCEVRSTRISWLSHKLAQTVALQDGRHEAAFAPSISGGHRRRDARYRMP